LIININTLFVDVIALREPVFRGGIIKSSESSTTSMNRLSKSTISFKLARTAFVTLFQFHDADALKSGFFQLSGFSHYFFWISVPSFFCILTITINKSILMFFFATFSIYSRYLLMFAVYALRASFNMSLILNSKLLAPKISIEGKKIR